MPVLTDNLHSLREYFQTVTGLLPELEPLPSGQISKLPLFIRERYQWHLTRFLDHEWLFAVEKEEDSGGEEDRPTPGEYASQAESIAAKLGKDVVFVLNSVPAFVRNRLVHFGVSFIVPGSQMFLPLLLVDLREHFPRSRPSRGEKLVTSAQLIVLYQLVHGSLNGLAQQEIAKRIGYSAMTVSNARDELDAHGLCDLERDGRSIRLRFPEARRELWGKASELMSSPVHKTDWITGSIPEHLRCHAGVSALSSNSMLSGDDIPTFAIFHKEFAALLETEHPFHFCPLEEVADARIETWKYDPLLLAKDPHTVDPFSLYLSLEDSPDERIQQELEHLIAEIEW